MRINNYEDLLKEKSRLKLLSKEQEGLIKHDLEKVKEHLTPANMLTSIIKLVFPMYDERSSLLANVIKIAGTSFIATKSSKFGLAATVLGSLAGVFKTKDKPDYDPDTDFKF